MRVSILASMVVSVSYVFLSDSSPSFAYCRCSRILSLSDSMFSMAISHMSCMRCRSDSLVLPSKNL